MKSILSGTALVILALAVVAPTAQAASANETLARMDGIIAEMQRLRAEFATLLAANTPGSGVVLGAATSVALTDELAFGVTNGSITKLQKLLATDSEIYPEGTISGFFGPKTQEAIRNFQTRFGLDPVGVVGPATKAILEAFMTKYPSDTYPAGVLKGAVPTIAGAATTVTPAPSINPLKSVKAEGDGEDYDIDVVLSNGKTDSFVAQVRSEADVANVVARKLGVSVAQVKVVLSVKTIDQRGSSNDEDDADKALSDAEDALDNARDEVEEAIDNGDRVRDAEDLLDEAEDTLDEAEAAYDDGDYDEAIDLAREVEDLVEEALDEL